MALNFLQESIDKLIKESTEGANSTSLSDLIEHGDELRTPASKYGDPSKASSSQFFMDYLDSEEATQKLSKYASDKLNELYGGTSTISTDGITKKIPSVEELVDATKVLIANTGTKALDQLAKVPSLLEQQEMMKEGTWEDHLQSLKQAREFINELTPEDTKPPSIPILNKDGNVLNMDGSNMLEDLVGRTIKDKPNGVEVLPEDWTHGKFESDAVMNYQSMSDLSKKESNLVPRSDGGDSFEELGSNEGFTVDVDKVLPEDWTQGKVESDAVMTYEEMSKVTSESATLVPKKDDKEDFTVSSSLIDFEDIPIIPSVDGKLRAEDSLGRQLEESISVIPNELSLGGEDGLTVDMIPLKDAIVNYGDVADEYLAFPDEVVGMAKDFAEGVMQAGVDTVAKLMDTVSGSTSDLLDTTKGFVERSIGIVNDFQDIALSTVTDIVDHFVEEVTGLVQSGADLLADFGDMGVELFEGAKDSLMSILPSFDNLEALMDTLTMPRVPISYGKSFDFFTSGKTDDKSTPIPTIAGNKSNFTDYMSYEDGTGYVDTKLKEWMESSGGQKGYKRPYDYRHQISKAERAKLFDGIDTIRNKLVDSQGNGNVNFISDFYWGVTLEIPENNKNHLPILPYKGWFPVMNYQLAGNNFTETSIETYMGSISIPEVYSLPTNLTMIIPETSNLEVDHWLRSYAACVLQVKDDQSIAILPYKSQCIYIKFFWYTPQWNLLRSKKYICIPKIQLSYMGTDSGSSARTMGLQFSIVGTDGIDNIPVALANGTKENKLLIN